MKLTKRLTHRVGLLFMLAGSVVAFTADTASAQRRGRGGIGVNIGPGGVSIGTGNPGYGGWGYGSGGWGYGNNWSGNNYGYGSNWNRYPGYSSNYYRSGYYTQPYYSSGYYSTPSYYYSSPTVVVPSTTVVPAAGTVVPSSSDTAMQITDVTAGPAHNAGLQRGDIILSVDNSRVQSFNDLRSALSGKSQVSIDFFNPSTNQRATKNVAVNNGTIGVSVVETAVSVQ